MKRFFKYILAFAAVSFAANACVEEEPFQPGESEEAGCYGVYFPAQETSLVLDPADPTAYTITVARTNTNDNIKVPYVFTSSSEDVFKTGDIEFEDGQSETELSLVFDAAEVGQTYTCSFQIADSKYASKYSSNPANLDFSVIRERWNELGAVTFEEYIMWGFGVPSDSKYAAIIYQSDTDHNIFRVENPFAKRYTNFTDGSDWFTFKVLKPGDVLYKGNTSGYETKITENNLVYFSDFNTGYTNSNYGAKILLCHPSGFNNYKAKEESWKVSRVLQWQDNGLPAAVQIGCYYYMNGIGGWDYSQEPCLLFVFPGAVLTDYTFEVEAGITEDGELPLYFELGADVDVVKYAIYEGNLNSAQVSNHVEAIISGEDKSSEVSEDSEVRVTLGETGIYTLVAVSFDQDGKAQESNSISFTYLAASDTEEYDVAVNAGLELTSKYESKGHNKTNSIEFYIYGNGITELYYSLYKTATVEKYGIDAVIEDLLEGDPASANELKTINGSVYSDLFINLDAKTSYTLVVYASNGYAVKTVTAEIETEGLPLEFVGTGTYTYNFFWEGDDTGLEVYVDPNVKDAESYQILNWGGGVTFKYTLDPKTGKVNVPLQPIGYNHPAYGAVYVMESKDCYLPTYEGYADLIDSYYDAQKDTTYFAVTYLVSAGIFGNGIETFAFDGAESQKAASSLSAILSKTPAVKASVNVNKMPRENVAGFEAVYERGQAEFSVTSSKPYTSRKHTETGLLRNLDRYCK